MKLSKIFSNMESAFLKCFFYYFEILGVAPINFNIKVFDGRMRLWLFSPSYIGITYSLLLCFGTLVWSYLIAYKDLIKNDWFGIIRAIYYGSFIIGNACIILSFCIRHEKMVILLNKINHAREVIYNGNSNLQSQNKWNKQLVFLLMINMVLFCGYYMFINFTFSKASKLNCFLYYFHHLLPNAVILQYYMFLKLIEHLFTILNENYSKSSKNTVSIATISGQSEFQKNLSQFWDSYSKLSEIIRNLTNFYSFPILFSISLHLLEIILLAYKFTSRKIDLSGNLFNSYEIITQLYPLLILTACVTNILDQDKKTRIIINDCLKNMDFCKMIADKLARFSIYLLHNKIKISFHSVCSLDISFMVKMIGAVTTYLAILLQFQPKDLTQHLKNATEVPTSFNESFQNVVMNGSSN